MRRLYLISILVLIFFGNCHKQVTEQKISYSIRETSVDSPSYNVTYTSDKTGATTNTNTTAANWDSGGIILNKEQFVSITVDCSAPLYDFVISVFVDGNLYQQKELHNPNGSVTISGNP